jgi:hypothetical protein
MSAEFRVVAALEDGKIAFITRGKGQRYFWWEGDVKRTLADVEFKAMESLRRRGRLEFVHNHGQYGNGKVRLRSRQGTLLRRIVNGHEI